MKKVFWCFFILLFVSTVAYGDCGKITLKNNSGAVVVGIVNGYIDGQRTSYMGSELDPGESFYGSHCYHTGWYDVLWIIPGEPNDIRPFYLGGDITLLAIEDEL